MKTFDYEKSKFLLALEKAGIDKNKCRLIFKLKGLYEEPEMWIYPKKTGELGTLVTRDTIADIDYLREYIHDFCYFPNK